MKHNILLLFMITLLGCQKDDHAFMDKSSDLYFPPSEGTEWAVFPQEEADFNEAEVNDLLSFLEESGSRAFIVLKDGKILFEEYWGDNILGIDSFDQETKWYWASAGKTLTSTLVGIAQQESLLDINDKVSDYLGSSWTSMSKEKEDLITIKHQLSMTTGLDYSNDLDCIKPECLLYRSDAGSQWYYHNAPYTLLHDVVSNASDINYNEFTHQYLGSKIGLQGSWMQIGDNNVYWSTARDAARFGLLLLNKGIWSSEVVLGDAEYFESMTSPSQNLNLSYGYLTWLNGQSSIILPSLPYSFDFPLSKFAPSDLFAAMGKNGQIIDVVPSENLVVVRMGTAVDDSFVPTTYHDDMWAKINAVLY